MSIQPNRVLSRIIEQVDQSDWPELACSFFANRNGTAIRLYRSRRHDRYASAFHFWVHALRDELSVLDRRDDLVGAAGHGLCRNQSEFDWRNELGIACPLPAGEPAKQIYRMLESPCRRSSVAETTFGWCAHFWGHGGEPSWRREAKR